MLLYALSALSAMPVTHALTCHVNPLHLFSSVERPPDARIEVGRHGPFPQHDCFLRTLAALRWHLLCCFFLQQLFRMRSFDNL